LVETSGPVLILDEITAGYGRKPILKGVSLRVEPGEIVALIGHNGAGKSTVLKSVFGLLPPTGGRMTLWGSELRSPTPAELLRRGVAYVPQGNRIFPDLTVRENLEIGSVEEVERILALFPRLGERLRQPAGSLSGGEKQMLALATALLRSPRLLLLDEPSMGLAPPMVTLALGQIRRVAVDLKVSVLIVEQKVREVIAISDRIYVLRHGAVAFTGAAESLRDEEMLRAVYL